MVCVCVCVCESEFMLVLQSLTVHEDSVPTRKIAFTLQLTHNWTAAYGGLLHFYGADRASLQRALVPTLNSFTFFDVWERSQPHAVTEVLAGALHPRIALTGWFQGVGTAPAFGFQNYAVHKGYDA